MDRSSDATEEGGYLRQTTRLLEFAADVIVAETKRHRSRLWMHQNLVLALQRVCVGCFDSFGDASPAHGGPVSFYRTFPSVVMPNSNGLRLRLVYEFENRLGAFSQSDLHFEYALFQFRSLEKGWAIETRRVGVLECENRSFEFYIDDISGG